MKWGGTCYYIYSKNAWNHERRFDTSIYTLFTVLAHHTFNLKCFFHKLTPIFTVIIAYFHQNFLFFTLHAICVMVPIGQYTHHVRGLYTSMVRMPSIVLVSIRL